jgi:putative lipoprotein (fragment)
VLRVLFVWGCGGWYGKVFAPFIFALGGEKSACNADIANNFSLSRGIFFF